MGYQYRGKIHDLDKPLNPAPEPLRKVAAFVPFDPAYCGTPYGTKLHRKHGQEPCQPCQAATRAYNAEWRAKKRNGTTRPTGFNDDACGTYAGYHRHRRHNIEPCPPCWQANAQYLTQWRSRKAAA